MRLKGRLPLPSKLLAVALLLIRRLPTHAFVLEPSRPLVPTRLPTLASPTPPRHSSSTYYQRLPVVSLLLASPSSSSSFDLSKPVFDLYSLRSVRGDALTRYNTVNQSEPLRINLSLILTALLLCSPILVPEVTNNTALTTPQLVLNLVGAVATAYLGVWRNSVARNRQLRRWERELSALELTIQLPNVYDASSSSSSSTNRKTIERIGDSIENGKNVVAMRNFHTAVTDEFHALRRRWRQAGVIVVSDNDDDDDDRKRFSWTASPSDAKAYRAFWDEQLQTSTASSSSSSSSSNSVGGWFGLAANTGRSFGSGSRPPSSWLQVLGQSLPPLQEFSAEDDAAKDGSSRRMMMMDPALRQQQTAFYTTLTTTEDAADTMAHTIFSNTTADQVSEVIAQGGRLDPWSSCLEPDARPVGLTIVDVDDYIPSSSVAGQQYTTCVEVTATGETLLAVQTWNEDDGKLLLHQTIPWSSSAPAAGTLLCDCRGCVSLVRQ